MAFLMKLSDKKGEQIFAIAEGPPERDLDSTWDEALDATIEEDADLDYLSHPVVRANSAEAAIDRFVRRGLDPRNVEQESWTEEAAASLAVYTDHMSGRGPIAADNAFDWMLYRAWFCFLRAKGPVTDALRSYEIELAGKKPRRVTIWGIDAHQREGEIGLNFLLEKGKEITFFDGEENTRAIFSGTKAGSGAKLIFEPAAGELEKAFGGPIPRLEATQDGKRAEPTLQIVQLATIALVGLGALLGAKSVPDPLGVRFHYSFGELAYRSDVYPFPLAEIEALRATL